MATNPTIQFKRKTTTGTPSSLSVGEPAVNTADNQLFIGTNGPAVKWVGAEIENSSTNGTTWSSDLKLATKKAIGDYFMPLGGGLFTGDVTLTGGSDLRFRETGGGTDYVAFQAPAAVTTSVTWTLPAADGASGEVLSTNGSGTLSWASAGSATTVTTNSDNTNTTRYIVLSTSAQSGATLYVDDTTGALSYNPSTAALTVTGDVNVNGGDLVTSASTASVFDTNATTLTVGAAATTGTFGYSSTAASTTNISTGAVASSTTKIVNIGTGGAASSTTNVNIGSSNGGTVTVNSNMTVSGDLTVSGTTTTVNSSTLSVQDPLIFLANNNGSTDAVDIGFYGLYDTSGSQDLYTGLFRDASDDKYKLFKSLQAAPTTTVNTGGTGYAVATLVADLEGKVSGLTVTTSTGTLTIANGKTLTASNTLTFTGTDSSSVAFGAGGTVAYIGSNNAFTGANTFTNATGQTFRPAATQDGIIIQGRAGGTSTYAVTLATATLGASRTFTLPDVDGTAITTGNLSSITTVGTISSGTWNGNAIGVAYGGTNITSYAVGDVIYASGATTLSKLSASSTAGAVLASTGSAAAPEYKTISFTNGSVTSGSGTLTLAVQNAAADGTTKGIATFDSTQFDDSSGLISMGTIDGGTYV
jgi:hypothetical protein